MTGCKNVDIEIKKILSCQKTQSGMRGIICAKGISQVGMLAFQFGAAREREKLAKRVSHRLTFGHERAADDQARILER